MRFTKMLCLLLSLLFSKETQRSSVSNSKKVTSAASFEGTMGYVYKEDSETVLEINGEQYKGVPFEEIQSFFKIDSDYYVCPKDKNPSLVKIDSAGTVSSIPIPTILLNQFSNSDKHKDFWFKCYLDSTGKYILVTLLEQGYIITYDPNSKLSENWYYKDSNTGGANNQESIYYVKGSVIDIYFNKDFNCASIFFIESYSYFKIALTFIVYSDQGVPIKGFASDKKGDITISNESASVKAYIEATETSTKVYFIEYSGDSLKFHQMFYEGYTISDNRLQSQGKLKSTSSVEKKYFENYNVKSFDYLEFANNSPYLIYKVTGEDNKMYWGEIDTENDIVLYSSDSEIEEISSISDNNKKNRGFTITTSKGMQMICPFENGNEDQESIENCPECSNKVIIDSLNGNRCVETCTNCKKISSADKYYSCNDGYYFGTSDCDINCDNLFSPSTKTCLTEDDCVSPNGKDKTNHFCIKCKDYDQYLDFASKACVDSIPEKKYVSDEDNNILKDCEEKCQKCEKKDTGSSCLICEDGAFKTDGECADKCGENLGYFPDTTDCVNCKTADPQQERYRLEGDSEECFLTPSSDKKYVVINQEFNIIGYCVEGCENCENKDGKPTCTSCDEKEYIQKDNNCIKLNENANLGLLDSDWVNCKEKKKVRKQDEYFCIDESSLSTDPNYEYYFLSNSEYGIVSPCDKKCKECKSKYGDEDNMGCTSCRADSDLPYLKYGSEVCVNNCKYDLRLVSYKNKCVRCSDNPYKDEDKSSKKLVKYENGDKCIEKPSNSYFIDTDYGIIANCDTNCALCKKNDNDNQSTCTECESGFYLSPEVNTCVQTCPMGYWKDAQNKKCAKCYQACESCDEAGTNADNKCLTCKGNFILEGTNCKDKCSYNWYTDDSGKVKCTTGSFCPDEKGLLVESSKECVSSCTGETYKYQKTCRESCPSGYIGDKKTNECVQKQAEETKCTSTTVTKSLYSLNNFENFIENEINAYFSEVSTENTKIKIIYGSDVIITIFQNDTCGFTITEEKEISYSNITNCVNKIKEENNLGKDYTLTIAEIEAVLGENSTNEIISYYIFDSAQKYSLDSCANEKTTKVYPLKERESLELLKAKELEKMNVDVFDSKDDFFNDFCFPYYDESGHDVTLKDRRSDYFSNSSFCEDGCNYLKVDFKTARITCECTMQTNKFNEIIDKLPIDDFPTSINTNNLIVVRCYNLVFNWNYMKVNIGNWIVLFFVIFEIPTIITFFAKGFNTMLIYLNRISQSKIQKELEKLSNIKKSVFIGTSFSAKKPNPPRNSNKKGSSRLSLYDEKSEEKSLSTHNKSISAVTSSPTPLKIGEGKKVNIIRESEFEESELDELTYEDAQEYDHRCICKFYWRLFKKKVFLLNTFIDVSPLEPVIVRIVGLILNLTLFMGLNAVLFNEEYISDLYNSDSNQNLMIFIFKNELPRSVYASIVTFFIGFLIDYAVSSKKRFETLIKKDLSHPEFLQETRKIMSSFKRKLIIFLVINFILLLFFWYYISAFCAVYQKSQVNLLIGTMISLVFCMLFQGLYALLVTIFRYIGLKCHISCIYSLTLYCL